MQYTPETIVDIEQIRVLSAVYARGLDRFNIKEIMSVFTSDAVFDATPAGMTAYEGTAAIEEFFGHNQQVMADQVHLFSNFVIELDGPTDAHGTSYLFQDGHDKTGSRIHTVVFNEDTYVKQDGQWLVSKRVCTPLLPPELGAYIDSL